MIKKIATLFLFCNAAFAQDIINSIPIKLKNDRDVFQVVNESTKNLTLFISDRKQLNAIKLDAKLNIVDSLFSLRPKSIYEEILGFALNNKNPLIFWSNTNHKKIYSQNFDFKKKTVDEKLFEIGGKNEKYLENFSNNGKFYVINSIKKSNDLKFYIFDGNGNMDVKQVDLTNAILYNSYYQIGVYAKIKNADEQERKKVMKNATLYLGDLLTIQKINHLSPISLTDSSKAIKLYVFNNEIKISNDCSNEVTQIVTISLNSFESSFTEFKKENFAELGIWGNSNSFFHEGNLLQMELNEEKMIISIKDENNQLKKKYEVKVNEEIDFKNSDIIQVGGVLDKYRILETTKQFLKKANSGNCGLSVYELNSNFYIEMGVSEQVNKGGGGMMMGGGLPMAGGVGGTSVVFNPTFSNFNSYKSIRVVSIKCLFDINFNHLKGDLKPLAFDKIKTFLDVKPEKKCQTIFQLDNAFYLGYYDGFKKLYNLTKFTD